MPSRIIKESITTSESLSEVSADAERLFWRLVVKADDFGLYYGNPRILASMCFPLDPPKEQKIRAWLSELVAAGMVGTYTASEDGKQYLKLMSWDKHQQQRAKKSKFPLPVSFDNTCNQRKGNQMKSKVPVWCEEATELLPEDVDILDDRLRGNLDDLNPNLYYQITMTFNPVSATHWIKARYFDKSDPDVLTHHSTYRTNRFIDPAYSRRMERRKEEDPDGYRVYGLGEWGELGGLILTNFEVHNFPTGRDYFDGFYYGQDFGFNHADAILGVGWKDGEIYVTSEIYVFEKDTEEIISLARQAKIDPRVEMFCDSAEPDRIRTWQKAGFRAYPVKKEPGSVKAQIDFLKGRKIHIHPSCVNVLKEVQQWKWKKDPTTGLYIDEPVEFMDDAMAALRYGVERPRRGSSIEVLK